jgi:hypothetical protein
LSTFPQVVLLAAGATIGATPDGLEG